MLIMLTSSYSAQLTSLPLEALEKVLVHLDRASLASLASTCRFFHSLTATITPGLRLNLYPHQVSF